MAAGDLIISSGNQFFGRSASDGTWSQLTVPSRSGVQSMCIGRDGTIHVGRGTVSSPRISSYVNDAWVNTGLPRNGTPTGIGIDADGVFHIGNVGQVYRVATNNPILTALPSVPIFGQIQLYGLSVRQSDGMIGICGLRNVFELAKGGSAWVESVIPTTLVGQFVRSFASCTYDHLGGLWVYDTIAQRYWSRSATDGTWSSDLQLPTTIGGQTINRGSINGSAFDQGRGVTAVRNMKLGDADIDAIKIGTSDVSAVYLGTQKIWG